ncbi:unnamed protein product [Prorocentrum cordatum]|uniref:Uncharacterized protein n=1 Tax=Prorocentrum cordatum TaxID=2364126 RepID=A0ABN9X7C2_9DINO|nr:unnamed protein product [Polarella glacialis]
MTRELHSAYFSLAGEIARRRPELGFTRARRLEFVFELQSGRELVLDMCMGRHPSYGLGLDIVTPIDEVAWAGVGDRESLASYRQPAATGGVAAQPRPFDDVAFLGLGFLVGRSMAVDTERGLLTVTARVGPAAGGGGAPARA